MESGQVVRRRMNTIAAHFAAAGNAIDDFSATASHLLPLNCSSSFSTPMRRFDNSMYFARQGSVSQSSFMRQVSVEESKLAQPRNTCFNCVNKGVPKAAEAPCFSTPAKMEHRLPNLSVGEPAVQSPKLSAPEPPNFARPNGLTSQEDQFRSRRKIPASQTNGTEWSPRMNVEESRNSYTVTVELPGVNVSEIRVVVNDRDLIITGKRAMEWLKVGRCLNDSFTSYHRREIFQGPYQAVWPLPANVNKKGVSAEFVEGILQISIPKL
ncbi:hypothetical protein Ancab_007673 [Ancistrocladus abbreviatus]